MEIFSVFLKSLNSFLKQFKPLLFCLLMLKRLLLFNIVELGVKIQLLIYLLSLKSFSLSPVILILLLDLLKLVL